MPAARLNFRTISISAGPGLIFVLAAVWLRHRVQAESEW
jgi:hypothetical protein